VRARNALRKCATLPVNYVASTAPEVAFRDLEAILATAPIHVRGRASGSGGRRHHDPPVLRPTACRRCRRILPALHNAGVAIDREQAHSIRHQRRPAATS
jgi:glutamate dehydrogenase